tara:strand:+ start:8857 stop:9849 length:993 start_codon:yes stop_codon:yes gene_type:complete
MPNRILRDWTDSHAVNDLSAEEERFFTRLLMKADDFGRFHGQDRLLNANLFPLHKFDDDLVAKWCDACVSAGILARYKDAKNRQYIEVLNFKQRTRQQISKFPNRDDGHMTVNGRSHDGQVTVNGRSNDRLDGGGDGDGDGGGGEVSKPTAPTDLPPSLEMCRNHFTKWPETKVEEVWQSFERAKVDGLWMWGKNPVNDPFEAFGLRLADRVTNTEPAPNSMAESLARLATSMGVPMGDSIELDVRAELNKRAQETPKTTQPQSQSKPPARLFVSELKEKKQVFQERLKEIQYRGFEQPTGFKYANKDDRMAAKAIKQSIREIDNEILEA